ncbi:TIGR03936 family radical SAM-associated protein, partial [Candidatus Omnitrophota bacterium]
LTSSTMHTLKISFHKQGDMIYFSQLDIFRLFIRALRRTELPIVYTGGFNPHPKISFSNAVKLGIEGDFETTFYFEQALEPQQFKEAFTAQIPPDLVITNISPKPVL